MSNFDSIHSTNSEPHNLIPKPKKRRRWKWFLLLAIVLAGFWTAYSVVSKTNQIFNGPGNIFSRFTSLLVSPDKPLVGEEQGMINILLMGVGGDGHNGAYLTDTMMVMNIDVKTQEIVLISIPRDFYLDIPNLGLNKINAAYAYAYRDNPKTAGLMAIAAAQAATGMTIPYYAVIDFKGFVKAIDDVGGIDITVDKPFTDASFPNDYPYDTTGYLSPVTFTKGPTHLNGQRALIFARSRHSGDNFEGSDFARSERQKKILTALKDRVLSLNLGDLKTINNLLGDFSNNLRTNLEPYEIKRLYDLSKDINSNNIYSFSLDPQTNLICSELIDLNTGKHYVPPVISPDVTDPKLEPPAAITNNILKPKTDTEDDTSTTPTPSVPAAIPLYVIHPCSGKTLEDIHLYVTNAPLLAKLKQESAVLEVQNSTAQTGLAASKFNKLQDLGMNVLLTSFKGKIPYEQTILYDNSHGNKSKTLDYLKSHYIFTTSDVGFPSSTADFVIILGKDSL